MKVVLRNCNLSDRSLPFGKIVLSHFPVIKEIPLEKVRVIVYREWKEGKQIEKILFSREF